MTTQRQVVTGVGVISPLGLAAQEHFQRILGGESALQVSAQPESHNMPAYLEARVTGFDRRTLIADRMLRKVLSPSSAYAVAAAGQAIQDAGLTGQHELLERSGLYVGSIAVDVDPEVFIPVFKESLTPQGDFEMSRFATRGIKLLDPLFLVKALPNAGLCGISILHRVYGPNLNVTNGAVSGLQAVAAAAAAIERGETQIAVAGGYDSLLRMDSVAEHLIANRLSKRQSDPQRACRPFDAERDGYAVGEGAAFVILETEAHARARGVHIYGELLAIAQTANASLLRETNSADDRALGYAARQVMKQQECRPTQLGAIYCDGLATQADDVREASVARRVSGDVPVPVTACTASLGFTGAASGVFSLIHAVLALDQQVVAPLINCIKPDPQSRIHFTVRSQAQRYERALVWNSDRGMKNIAVLVGAYDSRPT
jgi:3-oxoacyl-[acyl-carrier-protein] synthase II